MLEMSLVLHDIRSSHNVGAILRSAECFGVKKVYFGGYTPYPELENDPRLPHIRSKIHRDITKTSLGAEKNIKCILYKSISELLEKFAEQGVRRVALEQSTDSIPLSHYTAQEKVALLVGREVEGIDPVILSLCDDIVEIPMVGMKESLNVAVAAGIALYSLQNSYV